MNCTFVLLSLVSFCASELLDELPTENNSVSVNVCEDSNEVCAQWARAGDCQEHRRQMHFFCRKSCNACNQSGNTAATRKNKCILLIGGRLRNDAPPVEYYHPTEGVDCNMTAVGQLSTDWLNKTEYTSGCYVATANQIVTREGFFPSKPPILYRLQDGSMYPFKLPFDRSIGQPVYTHSSTTASISPSDCLSCGGYYFHFKEGTEHQLSECYQYSLKGDNDSSEWTPIEPLPQSLFGAASALVGDNDFYVVGGQNESRGEPIADVYRYNIREGRWYEETPMDIGLINHAAAALSSTELIVCGGRWESEECWIYSKQTHRWRHTGSLRHGRRGFAMLTFDGQLYAFGGHGERKPLKSVEMYDPTTHRWKMVKPLRHAREGFIGLVV